MKRTKHIELKIVAPCHENWDQMNPTEKGRFCASCQKEVVAFHTMTDAQILDFFRQSPKNVCGQFRPDQLKSYPLPAPPSLRFPLRAMAVGSVLALLVSQAVQGQETEVSLDPTMQQHNVPDCPTPWEGLAPDSLHAVSGTIRDLRTGNAIPNALIEVKTLQLSTRTDSQGRFHLPIPERYSNRAFTVWVQAFRYESEERTLIADQLTTTLNVNLRKGPTVLGDVEVTKGEVQMIMGKVAAPQK